METNNDNNLQAKLNDLYDYAEHHLAGRSDFDTILQLLYSLDEKLCDDTLTPQRLDKADTKLRNMLRAYHVDHSNGCVDRNYYLATDSKGRTNYSRRKQIKKPSKSHSNSRPKGTLVRDHQLNFDIQQELTRVEKALTKACDSNARSEAASSKKLGDYQAAATARRAELEATLKANPNVAPSVILRSPKFDKTNEPQSPTPR